MAMVIELVGTSVDHDFESGQSFNFVLLRIDDFQFRALVDDGVMKQAIHALRKREGLEDPAEEKIIQLGRGPMPVRDEPAPEEIPFVPASGAPGGWTVVEEAQQSYSPPVDDFADEGQID